MALKEDLEKLMNYESPRDKTKAAMTLRDKQAALPTIDNENLCVLITEALCHKTSFNIPLEDVAEIIEKVLNQFYPESRAQAAELERVKWQPIESAPKDGTRILLFTCGSPSIGWWDMDCFLFPFCLGRYNVEVRMLNKGATHWMPMPQPPIDLKEPKQ